MHAVLKVGAGVMYVTNAMSEQIKLGLRLHAHAMYARACA